MDEQETRQSVTMEEIDALQRAWALLEQRTRGRLAGPLDLAAAIIDYHERMELYAHRRGNEFEVADHKDMADALRKLTHD